MPNSIWDTRFTRAKPPMALDAAVVDALFALDDWITIHGAHVEIDGDGNVLHGAGGKFNGTNYYRHMNEKARAGRAPENPASNFNAAKYEKDVRDYVEQERQAAEQDAIKDRRDDLENAEEDLADAEAALAKAKEKFKTPRGWGKYEKAVQDAKDEADKLRSPQELQQIADQFYMLGEAENGAKYDNYAAAAEKDLEDRTREFLDDRLFYKNNFGDDGEELEGSLDENDKTLKEAIDNYVKENVDRVSEAKAEEAREKAWEIAFNRADARAEDLLDEMRRQGGIPDGVQRWADDDGNVRDENNQIVETADQISRGVTNNWHEPDAAGQKSIFGGSGWW